MSQIYDTGPTALLPLRMMLYSGVLSFETFHGPLPGPNSRTSNAEASMITTGLPGSTHVTCEELSRSTGVAETSVLRILTNDLMKRNISAQWVLTA